MVRTAYSTGLIAGILLAVSPLAGGILLAGAASLGVTAFVRSMRRPAAF